MTNAPASHGQWGGYRTSKAVAWVIDLGADKPAWIARFKDQTSNPLHLKEAKAASLAMAKGGCGHYYVADPIEHLNGLTATCLTRNTNSAEAPVKTYAMSLRLYWRVARL